MVYIVLPEITNWEVFKSLDKYRENATEKEMSPGKFTECRSQQGRWRGLMEQKQK